MPYTVIRIVLSRTLCRKGFHGAPPSPFAPAWALITPGTAVSKAGTDMRGVIISQRAPRPVILDETFSEQALRNEKDPPPEHRPDHLEKE